MESETNDIENEITRSTKLEDLPCHLLRRIFSLLTFDQVSRLREVCRAFNESGKEVLNEGHSRVTRRLKKEIARAERRVLYPTNPRLSYDAFHFLGYMYRALDQCTRPYLIYFDLYNFYFIPGKVLDEANHLLREFNSATTVPYFLEHVCDQRPHPLLNNFLHLTYRAYYHFINRIVRQFLLVDGRAYTPHLMRETIMWETRVTHEEIEMEEEMRNAHEERERWIECGAEMSGELVRTIFELKTNVLDLTRETEILGKGLLEHLPPPVSTANKRPKKLGSLPSSCIRTILSYLTYEKISQLRATNKAFDEAGKRQLQKGCEGFEQKLRSDMKCREGMSRHLFFSPIDDHEVDVMGLFLHCLRHYQWYLGENYYFIAGRVLDEFYSTYEAIHGEEFVDAGYRYRPHYCFFRLMDLVCRAVDHFKIVVVPKYFRSTQTIQFIPDCIASGDGLMSMSWNDEMGFEWLRLDKLREDEGKTIRRQKEKHRKYFNIIRSLKQTLKTLKTEIERRRSLLGEWKMLSAEEVQ